MKIISGYRNRDFSVLRKYAGALDIGPEIKGSKLFSVLIRKYHPDRHSFIRKQAAEIYASGDSERLLKFHNSFFIKSELSGTGDDTYRYTEKYGFDKTDFGYREMHDFYDADSIESDLEIEEDSYGFLEALNKFYFGGTGNTLDESDLRTLDGELDLSDYEISDLKGIEGCIYVEEMNLSDNCIEKIGRISSLYNLKSLFLSNNRIENIDAVKGLENLRVLDISFNSISEIDALDALEHLEYVNLLGNPLHDSVIVGRLVKKGIMVIFEDNILS
ncbi:MAG: leucine-rich repeat protein [Spirochaetes bacterium]|nr:leucine-rich repeat protein [Spirochaetota bacterium]